MKIARENGLKTTDITFEIVPSQRVLEGMSYMFPINFSHWSFGREYERHRTIYEHTGGGIPYEQVWNLDPPKAFLVESNPFALNALVIPHVIGHVDFFLANRYLEHVRSFSNIAEEARNAAKRFKEYEVKYGAEEVERTIDAGMSIWWQQHPDVSMEEELDNEKVATRLLAIERARLENTKEKEFKKPLSKEEIDLIEIELSKIRAKAPPQPVYDLLGYIILYSPKPLKSWQVDVLSVMRREARSLAPNMRTKMLNEGWATYWHVRIMRQLFNEGIITADEHGIFNLYHSGVTRENRTEFNWYRVGLKFFEHVKESWDMGRFGLEYEECKDPHKKLTWDTGAKEGNKKIFEIRELYSDRMAIEELFSNDFIRHNKLFFYKTFTDNDNNQIVYVIEEDDPEVIRRVLKRNFSLYGVEPISIVNAQYNDRRELLLHNEYMGYELDMRHMEGVLRNIFYLWGEKISLVTTIKGKVVICSWNGKEFKITN